MIPFGAIGGLAAMAARRRNGGYAGSNGAGGGFALRMLGWVAAGPLAIGCLVTRSPWIVAVLPVAIVLAWPSLVGAALARLGAMRSLFAMWRFMGHPLRAGETRQYAAFETARALLRHPDDPIAAAIEQQLAGCVELGVSGAAAHGLLALARGDRDAARSIFAALDGLPRLEAPHRIRNFAADVRAVSLAADGAWHRLVAVERGRPETRLSRLVQRVAGHRLRGTSGGLALTLRWLMSPRRRETRALLALVERPRVFVEATGANDVQGGSLAPFVRFLALPSGMARPEDLVAAVRALDAFRTSAKLAAYVQRRGLALAPNSLTGDGDAVIAQLGDEAESDLVRHVLDADLPASWFPPGPLGVRLADEVREERLGRVADLARDLERRQDAPEPEAWRAWGQVRLACERLLADTRDPSERQAIVSAVNRPLTSFAVHLCNVRWRRIFARHVFLFLYRLTADASSPTQRDLAKKNVDACRAENMSRGQVEGDDRSDDARVKRRRVLLQVGMLAGFLGWIVPAELEAKHAFLRVTMFVAMGVGVLVGATCASVARGLVEAVATENGIVLQSGSTRFLALREDLDAIEQRGARIVFRLRRAPRLFARRPYTLASSEAHAAEVVARWRARLQRDRARSR